MLLRIGGSRRGYFDYRTGDSVFQSGRFLDCPMEVLGFGEERAEDECGEWVEESCESSCDLLCLDLGESDLSFFHPSIFPIPF